MTEGNQKTADGTRTDRDATTERMAEVSHTHEDHEETQRELFTRGGRRESEEATDDE